MINSLDDLSNAAQMIAEQILLPCQCVLMWTSDETKVLLCSLHSRDYVGWDGKDEEFIKILTAEHSRQMKTLDKLELEKMR